MPEELVDTEEKKSVGLSMFKLTVKEHFKLELTYKLIVDSSVFCIEFKSSQLKRLNS